jgi:hypothetical protein
MGMEGISGGKAHLISLTTDIVKGCKTASSESLVHSHSSLTKPFLSHRQGRVSGSSPPDPQSHRAREIAGGIFLKSFHLMRLTAHDGLGVAHLYHPGENVMSFQKFWTSGAFHKVVHEHTGQRRTDGLKLETSNRRSAPRQKWYLWSPALWLIETRISQPSGSSIPGHKNQKSGFRI